MSLAAGGCPGRSPTRGSKNNDLSRTWGYCGGARGRFFRPNPADVGGPPGVRGSRAPAACVFEKTSETSSLERRSDVRSHFVSSSKSQGQWSPRLRSDVFWRLSGRSRRLALQHFSLMMTIPSIFIRVRVATIGIGGPGTRAPRGTEVDLHRTAFRSAIARPTRFDLIICNCA